jgi:hypothetical protein
VLAPPVCTLLANSSAYSPRAEWLAQAFIRIDSSTRLIRKAQ